VSADILIALSVLPLLLCAWSVGAVRRVYLRSHYHDRPKQLPWAVLIALPGLVGLGLVAAWDVLSLRPGAEPAQVWWWLGVAISVLGTVAAWGDDTWRLQQRLAFRR